jgi:hypothetical protein
MSELTVSNKINQLPPEAGQQVQDFIENLRLKPLCSLIEGCMSQSATRTLAYAWRSIAATP